MSKEIELKYRLDEQMAEPLLNDPWISAFFHEPIRELHMESTYFDTPSRSLQEKRITFRMRRENEITHFTVKTPVSRIERGEWEVLAETVEEALPALAAIGAPALPEPPFFACAQARFVRRAVCLVVRGTEIELSVDRGTLGTLPFCELELELKHGEKTVLEEFGAQLASKFALVPEPRSKFARAKLSQNQ